MKCCQLLSNVPMQIATVWQGAVAAVHAFPRTPDVVALANALAEEAGEPSCEELQAASRLGHAAHDSGARLAYLDRVEY